MSTHRPKVDNPRVWMFEHPLYDKNDPEKFPSELIAEPTARRIWIDICDQIRKIREQTEQPEADDLITHYVVCLKMVTKNTDAYLRKPE